MGHSRHQYSHYFTPHLGQPAVPHLWIEIYFMVHPSAKSLHNYTNKKILFILLYHMWIFLK